MKASGEFYAEPVKRRWCVELTEIDVSAVLKRPGLQGRYRIL